MFSERVPRSLEVNRISRAVREARRAGRALIDLTATNPTTQGIEYPDDILRPLDSPDALRYDPHPFGRVDARDAVAAELARQGRRIDRDRVVLTASTSEAYTILFKLLCEPAGDSVLVPVPSYPLFDHLTALDGVRSTPYQLEYEGRWAVSADAIETAWSSSVRAVLAVSPNNPTGSTLTSGEAAMLADLCARRDAALIVDEVFADYVLDEASAAAPVSPFDRAACLTFRLGGLSKSAGLPQVKLGWIGVEGPDDLVAGALDRLEVICDAYLSVSTPVQVAAPRLIASGAVVRARILERVRQNRRTLESEAASCPSIDVLPTEAGWSSVLRVPSTRTEEDLVLELIEQDGVLVHPGFFFDLPHEAFLVVSLLPEPAAFAQGIRRVLERADAA